MKEQVYKQIKEALEALDVDVCDSFEDIELPNYGLILQYVEDEEEEPQNIMFSILPDEDELDGSVFVQWAYQYPYRVVEDAYLEVVKTIAQINHELPLGSIEIFFDDNTLLFKYVLALQKDMQITIPFINDIFGMVLYAVGGFMERFEALEKKKYLITVIAS